MNWWCHSCVATTAASPISTESRGNELCAQFAKTFAPVRDFLHIEITGAAQRIFADKLRHERRLGVHVKTIERRAKDHFAATRDRFRNPAFGEQAKQIFVAEAAQFPARMQPRGKVEDIFVEKRIAHFHR